jgi:hypothetical protein
MWRLTKGNNSEKSVIFISVLLYTFIISIAIFQFIKTPSKVAESILGSEDVTISGTVGVYVSPTPLPTSPPAPSPISPPLAIFGYGPPASTIKIRAYGIDLDTISDDTGYFKFTNLPFPNIFSYPLGYFYPELCLSALDNQGIASSPVCVPPLPTTSHESNIGPILLAPTISLSQGTVVKGEPLTVSGETIPGSVVKIHLAYDSNGSKLQIISSVSAEGLPISTVTASSSGKYEFSIPTNEVSDGRIFTSTNYGGSGSPKSNTLTYYIKPISYRLVEIYQDTLFKIKPYILTAIIGTEVLILVIIVTISQKKAQKKK